MTGYRYLQGEQAAEAIEIFKLAVLAYPDSWNAYDSLGEAYMAHGDRELAIEHYERSLALNADNQNAVDMLGKLRQEP
jgi:tetratricopeptide (TPR) repeat protein